MYIICLTLRDNILFTKKSKKRDSDGKPKDYVYLRCSKKGYQEYQSIQQHDAFYIHWFEWKILL